ncbi:MAG: hypothetical protein ACOYXA_01045 [Bacteroidota bacterium]
MRQLLRRCGMCWVWALLVLGCDRAELPEKAPSGADYFPLESGRYFIYQVDSTAIVFNRETIYQYQERHTITDSFRNEAGGITYLMQRAFRASAEAAWQPLSAWQVRRSGEELVVVEGNTPFVRLAFPVQTGRSWNGNAFNSITGKDNCGDGVRFTCDRYEVTGTGGSVTLSTGLAFNDTIEITEEDVPDVLTIFDVRKSVYAKGVGLVQREVTYYDYCTAGACFGREEIDSGLRYRLTLIEYGTL